MIRQVMTLVLGGILASAVLVGNAEACHKRNCGCAQPVVCVVPQPCVTYVSCAPRPKHCLFSCFKLPSFCHKQPVCAAPVCYTAAPVYYGPAPAPSMQATPQR
jgi:hypothetical protein